MKTLTVVLTMSEDTTSFPDIDYQGVFSSEFEAIQWVWRELKKDYSEFTAWPIGGDRERSKDIRFKESTAKLQLRPTSVRELPGIGPAACARVWIEQEGWEGSFFWVLGTYQAAELPDEGPSCGDLRRIEGRGGMIYTHVRSALGQQIEEHIHAQTAAKVQNSILALRTEDLRRTSDEIDTYLGDKQFICEKCDAAIIPGVLFPVAFEGKTDHAYVGACDECRLVNNDVDADTCAAVQLGHMLKRPVLRQGGHPFLPGLTFAEAEELTRELRERRTPKP